MARGPVFSRIDRYVFRQLLLALVAVTGGLVALIWLTQSLRFVEMVVNRGLSLKVFLELTGLLIPSFIAVILPITTYVVIQFVYQRLAGDRELTVMRSAGLSQYRLSRPALGVIVVSLLAGYGLNLWLVPVSYGAFREYQFEIRNRIAAFLLQEGVFTSISDDLTVYVRARDRDGTLRGILVDDGRDKTSHATIMAESGRLVMRDSGAPSVVLENGSRQEIDKQTGRLNVLTFRENQITLAGDEHGEAARLRDVNEMGVGELLHPNPAITPARDFDHLYVEAHKRLSSPLTGFSYGMVALVAVLTGAFRRHGGILRPLAAILVVVGLLALQLAVGNLAVRDVSLTPLLWVHAVLPGLVGAWILFVQPLFAGGGKRLAGGGVAGRAATGGAVS